MNTRSVFPFSYDREWLPEQSATWRDRVYFEPSMLRHYDSQQSVLIHGVSGSGLSAMAQSMMDIETARKALVVEWKPTELVIEDFVKTVVARIDEVVVQRAATPSPVLALDMGGTALEAWYTLLRHYHYRGEAYGTVRWLKRHLGMAEEETISLQQALEHHNHATFTDVVDDLLEVTRVLGFQDIVCVVDNVTHRNLSYLQTWLEQRALQTRRGLRVVVTVPTPLYSQLRDTSRWSVLRLEWTEPQIRAITRNALSTALQEDVFVPDSVFDGMQPLFEQELGMTPYGAIALAEALYWWLKRYPNTPPDMQKIKTMVYMRRIPLRVDELSGNLYRRLLPLSPLTATPRTIFNILHRYRGAWVEREELLDEVRTPTNLHAVIRRIRKVIEPNLGAGAEPIYLHTRHGEGYKLDNVEE